MRYSAKSTSDPKILLLIRKEDSRPGGYVEGAQPKADNKTVAGAAGHLARRARWETCRAFVFAGSADRATRRRG
jgi:hypothetical protein